MGSGRLLVWKLAREEAVGAYIQFGLEKRKEWCCNIILSPYIFSSNPRIIAGFGAGWLPYYTLLGVQERESVFVVGITSWGRIKRRVKALTLMSNVVQHEWSDRVYRQSQKLRLSAGRLTSSASSASSCSSCYSSPCFSFLPPPMHLLLCSR